MPKWLRWGIIAAVLLGCVYYWLLIESHVPGGGSFNVDMATVRRLAGAVPGDKPRAIHVEQIAFFEFPGIAVMAGDSWSLRKTPVFSYQLIYPDHTAIIDTGVDPKLTKEMRVTELDPGAYARMSKALEASKLILITHEHPDHIGGLTAQPGLPLLLKAVRLTRSQAEHADKMLPAALPPGALTGYSPLNDEPYQAIAPGVVLIGAPGHTPGSQMIFVQTAEGGEFLFLGDVAWQTQNIDRVRERPRLMTWFLLKEDRAQVMWELAALHELRESEPKIHMIPGHDGTAVAELIETRALHPGFE
jgi:glyoxylase-like metal-dependent hydrolase (beta-lactamase superfamily II)